MVDPQTSRFWRAAVQSGLVDHASLQACWDKIPEEKRTADAIDRRIARQAVNAGFISIWQAQQLMTGRVSGFRIDRYVLLDLLGQGGMGRVYLAKDTRLGRQVAIKVLSTSRMNNPRAIVRFQREGKVGAQLQHENLVRIYDEGESGTIRYLVMEFIEGKNIAQLIGAQGAIDWPSAVRLVRQVALGLEHAHQKGLIHRDVNPSNILVTRDGTAKLTDLGLAIDLADEANVTRDGATVGTFDYISPEQAKHSREVDTRSDIYSLGCTLYHMISGRVPFPVPSLPEKLYAHQLHDADALHAVVNDVPEGLSRVVKRMMAKRPEARYQTPMAVAQALEPFVDDAARLSPTATSEGSAGDEIAAPGSKTRVATAVRSDSQAPEPPPEVPTVPESTSTSVTVPQSDPDLTIFGVNIGPDEPLRSPRGGSIKSKTKSKSKSNVAKGGEESASRRRTLWVAIAVVVLILAAGGIGIIVMANRDRTNAGTTKKKPETNATSHPLIPKSDPSKPPAISVVSHGQARVAESLAEAIGMASAQNGEIVLSSSRALRLTTGSMITLTMGRVTIRAAEGTSPILAIDVGGDNAPLSTLPSSSLTLKGLKVIAHYDAQENPPPPLIQSSGNLRLEGCTFLATGSTGRSRAALVQGLTLEVESCLFAGFDRPINVEAYPGSVVSIKQSILVRAGGTADTPGWVVRAQCTNSLNLDEANQTRTIAIDHTTIQGGGLLDVSGFSATKPLTVNLDHVASQSRALLTWSPPEGELQDQWAKGLKWTGKGNRYDVTGGPWVLMSANAELPMQNTPTDLKGWSEAVKSDRDAVAESFQFAAGPALVTDITAIDPEGFALVGVEGVGADPKKVGPSRPSGGKP